MKASRWLRFHSTELILGAAVAGFVALLLLYAVFQGGRQTGTYVGVVETAGFTSGTRWRKPQEIVLVRLDDNKLVSAVAPSGAVLKGERVTVNEYTRLFSSGTGYVAVPRRVNGRRHR